MVTELRMKLEADDIDEEFIRKRLKHFKINYGPITPTTRQLYWRIILKEERKEKSNKLKKKVFKMFKWLMIVLVVLLFMHLEVTINSMPRRLEKVLDFGGDLIDS